MGTVDGPEFCSCLTLFHIESVGFLDNGPWKYATWNLRYYIYALAEIIMGPMLLKNLSCIWRLFINLILMCEWRHWMVLSYRVCAVGVGHVDFKMRTTSMYELTQLQKGCFS